MTASKIRILDPRVIRDLFEIDKTGTLLNELIEVFKSEAPFWVASMQHASESENTIALNFAAHRFRSTCYNIGAVSAAMLATKIESASGELNPDFSLIGGCILDLQDSVKESLWALSLLPTAHPNSMI